MEYIKRKIAPYLTDLLKRHKNILLLGPRQTGKTTLLQQLTPDRTLSFIQPRVRLQYEIDPSSLADEVEALASTNNQPLIIIDEIQKVPLIMDVIQDLIDRKKGQFILTGSSARKLKYGSPVNMLPGRVIPLYLDPLMLTELPEEKKNLESLLLYGSLPQIITSPLNEKEELLSAYVTLYLEDEIRAEAAVRNLGSFAKFLILAASESGYTVNYSKLSQTIGVSRNLIVDYYQILEDCLIAEPIEPLIESKIRHKLSKSKKYVFFDLGVRRLAANEGTQLPEKFMGHLFEQFVGLELLRQSRLVSPRVKVRYWKDNDGPEVDWILEFNNQYIPVEVKYTENPQLSDAKHLMTFLEEYENATEAFIVCRISRRRKIADRITALPWQDMDAIINPLNTR